MTDLISYHHLIANEKPNFINLLKKTSALGERYNNGYGPEDVRAEFFTQFSLLNLWLLIQFDSFLDVFAPNSYKVSRYAQFTPQDTIQFMAQYDKINRASYCTDAMFDVEHFLNSVAKPLDIKTDGGYWNVTERLRKKPLNLTEQQFYILNVPAALRNSLHNNGYHKKQGFEVVICGNLYKFVDGEQVKFAGWDNLYIMFDKLLNVIEVIIESKRVKQEPMIPHNSMTYHDTQ